MLEHILPRLYSDKDSPGGRFVCLSFLGMTSATAKPELGEPQAELWDVEVEPQAQRTLLPTLSHSEPT